jgi:GNAT superfamily N-acetyltransferase
MPQTSSRRHSRVRLRRATAADATKAADVWRVAWWDGHRGHVPAELAKHRADDYFWRQSATWIPLTTVAVDAADTIVGVVIVERDELVQLAVNGGVRRLGVGAALLQAAEDEIGAEHEHACWIALHITMLLGNRNPMLNLCWRYLARPPGSAVVVAETSDPTSSVPRLTDDAAQRWDAVERKPAAKS